MGEVWEFTPVSPSSIESILSLWHSMEAVAFFLSLSSPLSSLLCSLVLRDSLCTALQTERLWILPIRNHDNRYFADWIRLCPGLSKNSDWSCGKSGQHWDWDYQSQYGFYQGEAHGFTKENWLYWRQKWTKLTDRVAWKIGMRLLAPKTKQSYLFLAPPHSGLGKAVAGIYPRRAMQWDALASSPTLQTLQTLPHPPTTRLRSLWTASLSSGSDQRRISGCGTGWLLARPDSLPLWLCRVCAFVLLRCFSCSHTVLPKEHSLGVIFFLLTFLMLCCIFLQFYLHFITDYTLYDCVCDE